MSKREIIPSADGSMTLYVSELDETYHSRYGAINESKHVFINAGLRHVMGRGEGKEIKILEMGMGTGLNVLLTALESFDGKAPVSLTTLEKYPVDSAEVQALNYHQHIKHPEGKMFYDALHCAPWGQETEIHPFLKLEKLKIDLKYYQTEKRFDLIFYDAFAPRVQPNLWTLDIFKKIAQLSEHQACFVTYCAKGQVRRDLQEAGFQMERLPGPVGKREMLRGIFETEQ